MTFEILTKKKSGKNIVKQVILWRRRRVEEEQGYYTSLSHKIIKKAQNVFHFDVKQKVCPTSKLESFKREAKTVPVKFSNCEQWWWWVFVFIITIVLRTLFKCLKNDEIKMNMSSSNIQTICNISLCLFNLIKISNLPKSK